MNIIIILTHESQCCWLSQCHSVLVAPHRTSQSAPSLNCFLPVAGFPGPSLSFSLLCKLGHFGHLASCLLVLPACSWPLPHPPSLSPPPLLSRPRSSAGYVQSGLLQMPLAEFSFNKLSQPISRNSHVLIFLCQFLNVN